MNRLAVWLAELTDRWARRLYHDPTADMLAAADLDHWAVDHGVLVLADLTYLDEYRARRNHPAAL